MLTRGTSYTSSKNFEVWKKFKSTQCIDSCAILFIQDTDFADFIAKDLMSKQWKGKPVKNYKGQVPTVYHFDKMRSLVPWHASLLHGLE